MTLKYRSAELDKMDPFDRIQAFKKKKYPYPWTPKRSRVAFVFHVIKKWFQGSPGILFAEGGHYIDGPMGSGKTLLMNIILEIMLSHGGFAWANIREFLYKPVKTFDLDDLFADGKQKYRLDSKDDKGRYCKALILDEVNATFNRRQNHQRAYNDTFIPLIKMLVSLRNASNIPRFYLIGQSLLLQDGQLQEVIKYRHFVKSKKRWRYWFWRNQLKCAMVPYKIKIEDYIKVGTDEKGAAIWQKMKGNHVIKVDPWMLETFNTHAFADLFTDIPLYSGKKPTEK